MNKHLLAFLLCFTLISSAHISSAQARYTDRFFVTAEIGSIHMEKVMQRYTGGIRENLTSDTNLVIGLGVGYYFLDHLRGDITYQHFSDNKLEIKNSKIVRDTVLKNDLHTATFNLMADILPIGPFKLIGGAGIGVAVVQSTIDSKGELNGVFIHDSFKAKQKVNLSYALTAGLSFDVSQDLNLEAKYSYRNFQKTATFYKTTDNLAKINPKNLRGHIITAGFRVDI